MSYKIRIDEKGIASDDLKLYEGGPRNYLMRLTSAFTKPITSVRDSITRVFGDFLRTHERDKQVLGHDSSPIYRKGYNIDPVKVKK
jgi:hypothetical protein